MEIDRQGRSYVVSQMTKERKMQNQSAMTKWPDKECRGQGKKGELKYVRQNGCRTLGNRPIYDQHRPGIWNARALLKSAKEHNLDCGVVQSRGVVSAA